MSTFNGAPGSLNANENKKREIAGNRKITNQGEAKKEKKVAALKETPKGLVALYTIYGSHKFSTLCLWGSIFFTHSDNDSE